MPVYCVTEYSGEVQPGRPAADQRRQVVPQGVARYENSLVIIIIILNAIQSNDRWLVSQSCCVTNEAGNGGHKKSVSQASSKSLEIAQYNQSQILRNVLQFSRLSSQTLWGIAALKSCYLLVRFN